MTIEDQWPIDWKIVSDAAMSSAGIDAFLPTLFSIYIIEIRNHCSSAAILLRIGHSLPHALSGLDI